MVWTRFSQGLFVLIYSACLNFLCIQVSGRAAFVLDFRLSFGISYLENIKQHSLSSIYANGKPLSFNCEFEFAVSMLVWVCSLKLGIWHCMLALCRVREFEIFSRAWLHSPMIIAAYLSWCIMYRFLKGIHSVFSNLKLWDQEAQLHKQTQHSTSTFLNLIICSNKGHFFGVEMFIVPR
jgi:hypothetical protein